MGEIEAARSCAIIVLETDLRQISVRFGPQNPTKICPKRAPKAIKKEKKKMLCVGSRTGRVLVDFDSPPGARNGPDESDFRGPARSRAHFKTKVPPRSHPWMDFNGCLIAFDRFGVGFGLIFGSRFDASSFILGGCLVNFSSLLGRCRFI